MTKHDKLIDSICYKIINSVIVPDLVIINNKVFKKVETNIKKRLNTTEEGVVRFLGVRTIGSKQLSKKEIIIK